MISFKEFYNRKLNEEKLLKKKTDEDEGISLGGELTEPSSPSPSNDVLTSKPEDNTKNKGILKAKPPSSHGTDEIQFKFAKPVFNKIDKRPNLSSNVDLKDLTNEEENVDETVHYSTEIPSEYPTGPIQLGNNRLISSKNVKKDDFSYDVYISKSNNLFSFIQDNTLFQLNSEGVMRFKTQKTEDKINSELKKLSKKGDAEDYDTLKKVYDYLKQMSKPQLEKAMDFLKHFNDNMLFWKLQDTNVNSDEEKSRVQKMID